MSSEINITLKANDEASSIIADAGKNITASMGKVEESGKRVAETQKQTNASAKNLVMGFSGLATSAFSLYNAYDRVMDMQVSVDRANLQVKQSANSVEDAQRKLNAAVEKYGVDSEQAKAAANDLSLAQERYRVSVDRAQLVQDNMNEAMVSSALTVIPTVITAIGSLSAITESWSVIQGVATGATSALGAALDFLAANPIMLVVTAIGVIIAALIAAYETCPPFRDAINAIGAALGEFFGPILEVITKALEWLWNNVLVPLGNFIGGALLGAWNAFANGLSWAYNNLIKPVFDALTWVYNNILKPIGDFFGGVGDALSGVGSAISGAFGGIGKALGFAEGGIVTGPTFALIGEAGPEAVVPLREFGSLPGGSGLGVVNFNAPLITIEGNADRATVEAAAQRVMQKLRTVIVEASSSVAPATRKRIRTGGRF